MTRRSAAPRSPPKRSARHSCSPPWSARASWPSGWPAETARSRCSATHCRPARCSSVLILMFGPLSGAHFNPAVSLAFSLARRAVLARCRRSISHAQIAGGIVGVLRRASDVRASASWQISMTVAHRRRANGLPNSSPPSGCCSRSSAACACACGGRLRGRPLHHGGLLVHRVDLVRQSGGDAGALAVRHVRRHSAGERPGIPRCPACRRWSCGAGRRMAVAKIRKSKVRCSTRSAAV